MAKASRPTQCVLLNSENRVSRLSIPYVHLKQLRWLVLFVALGYCQAEEQYYPQRVELSRRRQMETFSFESFSPSGQSLSLSINSSRPSNVQLSVQFPNAIGSVELIADSLVDARFVSDRWMILCLRNDSLFEQSLTSEGSTKAMRLLAYGRDLRQIASSSSSRAFVSADSVWLCTVRARSETYDIMRVARDRRQVVFAAKADSAILLLSTLNGDSRSAELYRAGQWRSLGIVQALESMACIEGRYLSTLVLRHGRYVLNTVDLTLNAGVVKSQDLPADMYEACGMDYHLDTCLVVFRNGVVRCTPSTIVAMRHFSLNELSVPCTIEWHSDLCSVHSGTMFYEFRFANDPWYRVRYAASRLRQYGLLIVLFVLSVFLWFRTLRYRRQLHDVLELGTSGISFVVDKSLRLRRLNSRARELFSMDAGTPLRRVLKFYCNEESQRVVESFVASASAARISQQQKLMVKRNGEDREIVFSAQPLRSWSGGYDGLVVNGVDITEELERKRLVNWAQLAHDMQTNLSIIKLNAEQLQGSVQSQDEEKRLRIRHQATLLLQRVRDIVSIGRDEQLHVSEIDTLSLFREVVHEFDDSSFAHVRFILPENGVLAKLDKAKMLRALRNAVENAVRAMESKNGSVEFRVHVTRTEFSIRVSDTGKGMDEQTLANFFKPYYSTYRQFGGTGIGTMIMQRAIALHGGTVAVETELGKGTTIIFHLPMALYVRG